VGVHGQFQKNFNTLGLTPFGVISHPSPKQKGFFYPVTLHFCIHLACLGDRGGSAPPVHPLPGVPFIILVAE
jgi:hypothetical protein